MKEKRTGKVSAKQSGTNWNQLRALTDSEIGNAIASDPNARRTDPAFWKSAKVVIPKPKQTVTIRLDEDLLSWFRAQKGYQTRINAILRTYMEAQKL